MTIASDRNVHARPNKLRQPSDQKYRALRLVRPRNAMPCALKHRKGAVNVALPLPRLQDLLLPKYGRPPRTGLVMKTEADRNNVASNARSNKARQPPGLKCLAHLPPNPRDGMPFASKHHRGPVNVAFLLPRRQDLLLSKYGRRLSTGPVMKTGEDRNNNAASNNARRSKLLWRDLRPPAQSPRQFSRNVGRKKGRSGRKRGRMKARRKNYPTRSVDSAIATSHISLHGIVRSSPDDRRCRARPCL